MRLNQKAFIGFSAALLACASAQAVTPGNSSRLHDEIPATPPSSSQRYDGIAERNVFGLRPPVAPTSTPPPEAPMSKVVLNGISTILAQKKALLTVIPQATKPGQPAKPESFILAENQREGEIEVLKIDEHAGIVKIDNSGKPMTITFEKTTNSQASTAYQPAPRGIGMVPNTVRTLPSRFPRSALSAAPAPLPAGTQTSPGTVPSATGYSTGYPANAYPANGYVTPNPSANNTASGGQQLTPEEQTFLSDVQNAVNNQNQPQPPKPSPGKTSLPPPNDNYLPKKIPLLPQ